MNKSSANLGDKITEQLLDTKLESFESNKVEDITDILSRNADLNGGFGWVGTPQKEIQTSLDSFSCDCPECCGAIA